MRTISGKDLNGIEETIKSLPMELQADKQLIDGFRQSLIEEKKGETISFEKFLIRHK